VARLRIVEKGDANGDGTVDAADAACVARHVVGFNATSFSRWAADANGDGSIDVADVAHIVSIVSRPKN